MKPPRITFLLLLLALSSTLSYSHGTLSQGRDERVGLWLVLRLRDYNTDMPVSNVSITATISTDWGEMIIGPVATNETGTVQVFLGDVENLTSPTPSKLSELDLSGNYTLIKIHDLFMEDAEYTSEYMVNHTRYSEMEINLIHRKLGNDTFIDGNLWVLKGKLIKIADRDPIDGQAVNLLIKPAVKARIQQEGESRYEDYFFFPVDYDVNIVHIPDERGEERYPRLRVVVNRNVTLINWAYHAFNAYVKNETFSVEKVIQWFSVSGFSLDREIEEFGAIQNLLSRVLNLYKKEEYGPALGGARISSKRLDSLVSWFSKLRDYAVLTTVGVSLFAYGLASFSSSFLFEEPSENKRRLFIKVSIFFSLIFTFSLTHPSLKLTYTLFIQSVTGVANPRIDLPTTFIGCFILASTTYFFAILVSLKRSPATDLSLQLGIRSLKRRLSRTLLTLMTITIVVSSAMIFVNVSVTRGTNVKASWKGSDLPGVVVKADMRVAPLSIYDVNWTRRQEWCRDLGFREEIRAHEPHPPRAEEVLRTGVAQVGSRRVQVSIVGIDPVFMERSYNFSDHIRGFWQEFSAGLAVAAVPASYEVATNDFLVLSVDEFLVTERGTVEYLGARKLGDFRVIGKFDPSVLSRLTKLDNTLFFDDTTSLVLIPVGAVKDPAMVISEVTVITYEANDPVDVARELAYTLGVPAVANNRGLAMQIEWSLELSSTGVVPYLFPLTIAGLMMYITTASVYEERKRELTTLATLGLDPGNTFQVFVVEALLLGLVGTFVGFFGSYIFIAASFYASEIVGPNLIPAPPLSYGQWSVPAIGVALFTGVLMVFLGAYIPGVRAQGLSLMGRVKKRQLVGELVSEGDITSFKLPIRETVQNSEMLYTYLRETVGKFKSSLVDPHSVKGEIRTDGSFTVSFTAFGSGRSVFVPCEVKGVRQRETLVPVIEFPARHREYEWIRSILRDLEEHIIRFSAWKEMQLSMRIIREAPKRSKTLEEILVEIRDTMSQIKDCNKKLKILEGQKGQLSEEIYNEFRQKYIGIIEEKSKGLRSMVIGLEPHHVELRGEIKKLDVELERITIAYSLGEIGEEDYVKTGGPLQAKLALLNSKVKELEDILEFIKKPLTIF